MVEATLPEGTRLGRFRLEPTASCGDLIQVDEAGTQVAETYTIKKISYAYDYIGGVYRMVRKGAVVKKTSRVAAERFLERLRRRGDEESP